MVLGEGRGGRLLTLEAVGVDLLTVVVVGGERTLKQSS